MWVRERSLEQGKAPLGGASEQSVEEHWWQPRWEKGGVKPGDRNTGVLLRRGNTTGCRRAFKAEWAHLRAALNSWPAFQVFCLL